MTDKIQFACSHCGSTLAVPAEYAGKKAKCPVCSSPITVPVTGSGGDEAFAAAAPASDTPWSSAAIGSQEKPSSVTPNESPFGEHDSFGAASGKPLSAATPSRERSQFGDLAPGEGGYAYPQDPPRETSVGRSIAGLAAAMGVGLAAMIVWLVLAAMSGYELGILAWGIGALIGMVAGVIARNPSPAYCAIVAVVAMGAILSAKLVMALAIVALHFIATAANTLEEISSIVLPDKYTHACVDQALADNLYTGERKQLAIRYNENYFEVSDDSEALARDQGEEINAWMESEEESEEESDEMHEFSREIHEQVAAANEQEKATWLANAHQRHPSWIEDYSHFQAAVIELMEQPDQLDGGLIEHAKYLLPFLVKNFGEHMAAEDYLDHVTPAEFGRRKRELNLKCAELLRGKSPAEIDLLLRQGIGKYPDFTPFPEAFTATLDKMVLEGNLDPALQTHAQLYLNTELGPDNEMAYYEAERTSEFSETDKAMRGAVNERLSALDEAARNAAIQETGVRHPNWYAVREEIELPDLPDLNEDLGDGSFVGSVKKVFRIYDLLWLFLGATTAYGTAMRRGRKA
jgi:hypothetical protein